MGYVVQRGWKPLYNLIDEYWSDRYSRAHMGNTKKAQEIAESSKEAFRQALCISIGAILTEQRMDKYPYIGDMIPMVEHWDVEKILREHDKEFPFARDEKEGIFNTIYERLVDLIEDDHLTERNTSLRRQAIEMGEAEPTEEDKAYFAEQAENMKKMAEHYGQLGSGKVPYLVKGGQTEIDV